MSEDKHLMCYGYATASPSKFLLEAVIGLDHSLLLDGSFKGVAEGATIGGVDVKVQLPDFEANDADFQAKWPSRLKAKWSSYFGKPPFADPFALGRVLEWKADQGPEGISRFAVSKLVVFSNETVSEKQAQKLLHLGEEWQRRLILWTEIIASPNVADESSDVIQHATDTFVWLDTGGSSKQITCPHPTQISIVLPDLPHMTVEQWRKLLVKASSDEAPPEAYVLLRNASRLLSQKRYRSSVLDAATAAEIALTELQARSFPSGMSRHDKDDLKKRYRQFDGLLDSLALMNVSRPAHVRDEVANPRNDAIHQGKEPSEEAARHCLAKAQEVVEHVFPIDSLL
jgi:HEPN domain-containing protein